MKLCKNNKCMGCTACQQICPVKAVKMHRNSEGFTVPQFDKDLCTNCGVCQDVCIAVHNVSNENPVYSFYALKATREIRELSSSGGFFGVLAEYVIGQGGYVCGAVFDVEKLEVKHIVSNTNKDVELMMESKYLESDLGNVFAEIRKLLIDKKLVLFSGTPCQNAGLKSFLQHDYDNLILTDVICRGVPSPKVFRQYLSENFGDERVRRCSFRDKGYFRWRISFNLYFTDGKEYHMPTPDDPYMWLFENGVSLRQSCGDNCIYNTEFRCADFTMGDYWAVGSLDNYYGDTHEPLFDSAGVSIISVNTKRGEEIFTAIREKFVSVRKLSMAEAVQSNYYLSSPSYDKKTRNRFFQIFEKKGFNEACKQIRENRYDIALLGLWNGGNYGAMVTAKALYDYLSQNGYDVVLVDTTNTYGVRDDKILKYITDCCNITKPLNEYEMSQLNNICDTFLIGSDQCWNPSLNRTYNSSFLLDFVSEDKKRISYSTSFGYSKIETSDEELEHYRHSLKKFDYISVREKSAIDIVGEFGCEAKYVIDPIFFLDNQNHIRYESESTEQYMLSYILDIKPDTERIIRGISQGIKMKNQCILGLDYTNPWEIQLKGVINIESIEHFLTCFAKANYIVTDSYHGMCLALIFNKPFRVIINYGRGSARFESLIETLHLKDVAIRGNDVSNDYFNFDWNYINDYIEFFKDDSKKWLSIAIEGERKEKSIIKTDDESYFYKRRILDLERKTSVIQSNYHMLKQYSENPAFDIIRNYFIHELKNKHVISIRGAGYHTVILLKILLPIIESKNICFQIFDIKSGFIEIEQRKIPVFKPSAQYIKESDAVIVSSWKYRDEIKREILNIVSDCNNIRMYDVYDELGLNSKYPFYDFRACI